MIDFSKYDKQTDLEGLKEDTQKAIENGGEFEEVPTGTYEVAISELELTMSKSDKPMVKIWYTILDGEFENNKIFQYQLVDTGQKLAIIKPLLEKLTEGEIEVTFESYSQYANLINEIKDFVEDNSLEYSLEYSENKKGFKTYKILEVFEG
jgi:hypothetical protein|nr:MAG TPA: Protein of unknown function (DUF669) [Caudoviricetes sp.]